MTKKTIKKPAKSTGVGAVRPKAPVRSAGTAVTRKASGSAKAAPKPVAKPAAKPSAKPASTKTPPVKSPNPALAEAPKPKPVTRADALFKVGDHVVYPFHAVGVVRSIEKLNITGAETWYYNLDFRNGELTVKLPVSQQTEKGMRKVIGKADVEKVMAVLKKKPPSEESDWKVRHNAYLEDLKSGDIYKAAKVARNLSKRGPEGELSMSEKRLLEAAVQQLVQEIAEASREPIEKVETEISKCLRAGRT